MTGPVKTEPGDIRSMVYDMEDCITRAESYASALGVLIEHVGQLITSGTNRSLRDVMFFVYDDLSGVVFEARRRWNELHEATKDTAREKTDA